MVLQPFSGKKYGVTFRFAVPSRLSTFPKGSHVQFCRINETNSNPVFLVYSIFPFLTADWKTSCMDVLFNQRVQKR